MNVAATNCSSWTSGNVKYLIAPESGIGMPRLRPRPGVAAETVVDLARATGRYPTLLKQLAHTRTLVLIDHGASPEILKRAEHLTVTARFTTATELLPQDQPILFAM